MVLMDAQAIETLFLAEIKAAMARQDISIQGLAKDLGIGRQTLGKILAGKQSLKVQAMITMCFTLDLHPGATLDLAISRWQERRSP